MARIAALEFHCPVFAPLSDEGREVWLETLCADLKNKTDAELDEGCRRWRNDPKNKWFPTPGQLIEACKNPYDMRPAKTYKPLDDLPPAMSERDANELIGRIQKKYQLPSGTPTAALKEEILARPPIPYVPMTKARRAELLSRIKQALIFKYENVEEAAKYIADLPE